MKKSVLWAMVIPMWLMGAEINWNASYAEAQAAALKENKPMMVLITSEQCRWCRKLESTTLQNDEIVSKINSSFKAVNVTRDKSVYPKNLEAKMVPYSYFIDPKNGKVLYSIPGFWDSEDYRSVLDDAMRKFKK